MVITIQFGECGAQIGAKFWEIISEEHSINPSGEFYGPYRTSFENCKIYFNETDNHKYSPRSIFIDLDDSSMTRIKNTSYRNFYEFNQFIGGKEGPGKNFAVGYRTEMAKKIEKRTLHNIRLQLEGSEKMQEFNIISSLCGGTGSGLMALCLESLTSDYAKNLKTTFSLLPSLGLFETGIETYNSILGLHKLKEYADQTICLDNKSLQNICKSNEFTPCNYLMGQILSEITAPARFENKDFHEIYTHLVPSPESKYLICGISPLCTSQHPCACYRMDSEAKYYYDIFDSNKLLLNCNIFNDLYSYIKVHGIFRGSITPITVDEIFLETATVYFNYICKTNMSASFCKTPPKHVDISSTFLGNTSAITDNLEQMCDHFKRLLDVKAHLHSFIEAGMEEEEFAEALNSVRDIIKSYDEN